MTIKLTMSYFLVHFTADNIFVFNHKSSIFKKLTMESNLIYDPAALMSDTFKKKRICYIFSMPTILFNVGHFLSYAGHTP